MKDLTQNVINWTRDEFNRIGMKKAIIGISGGVDSMVVAKICCMALGKDNVFGLLMPCGEQKDISDSYKVVDHLGIEHDVVNIGDAVREIGAAIPGFYKSEVAKTNLPARIRMSTVFAYGQTINALVMNTCNISESCLGNDTLFGDSCGSLAPIAKLTKAEVVEIGDDLGLPTELVHKTPIDGLQPYTDEERIGVTYHETDELIRNNVHGENYNKIMDIYKKNKFKMEMIKIKAFDPHRPNFITGENIE
jgi:NAD+ synthase